MNKERLLYKFLIYLSTLINICVCKYRDGKYGHISLFHYLLLHEKFKVISIYFYAYAKQFSFLVSCLLSNLDAKKTVILFTIIDHLS